MPDSTPARIAAVDYLSQLEEVSADSDAAGPYSRFANVSRHTSVGCALSPTKTSQEIAEAQKPLRQQKSDEANALLEAICNSNMIVDLITVTITFNYY